MTELTARLPDRADAGRPRPRGWAAARDGALRLALYAAIAAAALSPLLWVQVPALVDYPNHLARMWILGHDASIAALARNYVVDWRILPDLAMDLIVPLMAKAVSIELAGRLFIALTMILLMTGTAALHRALYGEAGIWPVWSALFVYNAALFWGFLNCLFGIGACLLVFSGWVATGRWRPAPRIALFAALASLLFLLHLFAFGLYGLLVASHELGRRIKWRRATLSDFLGLAAAGLQFVPGLALWYASLAHAGAAPTSFGGLDAKLYALLTPFTFGYVPVPLDALIAAAGFAFLALALSSGALSIAPAMRLPLAAAVLAAAAMPNVTSGSWLADIRTPVALPFLIIAGSRLNLPRRGLGVLLGLVALGILGVRVWTVTESWRVYDREFAAFRSASAAISSGAKLLVVASKVPQKARRLPGVPPFLAIRQPALYTHMAALSVIDRSAFVPYLFAGWTTIDVTAANKPISQHVAGPMSPRQLIEAATPGHLEGRYTRPDLYGELPYWRDWPRAFDFVLWLDLSGNPAPRVPKALRLLLDRGFFRIYRIARPREPAAD